MCSLEVTRLQRVLSPLSCFSVLILVCFCSHEKFSHCHLYFLAENHSTKCERQENLHLPPKAASASHQDLIAAPYKTLIGQSKCSGIPSPNLFSCLTAEDAQQGAISPEVCTAPMLWSSCSLREAHQDDREPYHRACLPSSTSALYHRYCSP